jgi:hypothetical protein
VTRRIDLEAILDMLHQDRRLYERMCEEGLLPWEARGLTLEHLEMARVVGTLVHDLEVNWAGAEVILRMRSELLATRRQMADLLRLLRDSSVVRRG